MSHVEVLIWPERTEDALLRCSPFCICSETRGVWGEKRTSGTSGGWRKGERKIGDEVWEAWMGGGGCVRQGFQAKRADWWWRRGGEGASPSRRLPGYDVPPPKPQPPIGASSSCLCPTSDFLGPDIYIRSSTDKQRDYAQLWASCPVIAVIRCKHFLEQFSP